MTTFEYKKELKSASDFKQGISEKEYLNLLGSDGWELVCVCRIDTPQGAIEMFNYFFKRTIYETKKTKCNCPDGATASSYANQIWVHAPAHMPKENGYCLDRCIAEEVIQLWMKGITTLGCCCGHNGSVPAYIQVLDSDIERMLNMGYEIQANSFNQNSFLPKLSNTNNTVTT